jgi:toxin ParE1/3/4
MNRCAFDPAVHGDLAEIWRYIAVENHSPGAADKLIDMLFGKFSLLAAQPLLGESREDLGENVRAFVARSYLILYRPIPNGIEILQVVHSARDITRAARTRRQP